MSPQHFQLGNKDYIAIAEENGTLNLLSRRGKSRINVAKKFKFSDTPISKEDSKFVVITADNKKESISLLSTKIFYRIKRQLIISRFLASAFLWNFSKKTKSNLNKA